MWKTAKATRKGLRYTWWKGSRRVMAAGKEQEANSKQDQNEREEQEEQVQKLLSVLGERL